MYKKFLNAILFGALILGSAGTITSCKDYDDEIDEINQKLNTLSSKDELAAQVSSLTSTISAAQAAAAQASTEAANALANAKEAAAQAEQAAAGAGQATGQAAEAINGAKAAATTAEAASKAATDAAAKAAKAAEDAAKALAAGSDATKAIAEAKAAAEAAQKAAADAKAGVEAAQKAAAEAAKSAVADAQKDIAEAAKKVAEEAAKEAAAAASKAELAELAKRIEALEKGADVKKLAEEVAAAKEKVDAIIGKISAAVTSVSLVDSYTALDVIVNWYGRQPSTYDLLHQGSFANFYWETYDYYYGSTYSGVGVDGTEDLELNFSTSVEKASYTFGQGWDKFDTEHAVKDPDMFPQQGAKLAGAFDFKEGTQRHSVDYFVVRVSPTNAVLQPEQIQLVNSQGVNLDEIVKITNVYKYDGLLSRPDYVTTRGEQETGLWIVEATLKNYDKETFEGLTQFETDYPYNPNSGSELYYLDQVQANYSKNANTRAQHNQDEYTPSGEGDPILINKILYAVQVNNTAEDAADRFVTSSYDLTLGWEKFRPANRLHFSVNGTPVENINNRFTNTSLSFLEDETYNFDYAEKAWLGDSVDIKANINYGKVAKTKDLQNADSAAVFTEYFNSRARVGYQNNDDRSEMQMIPAVNGQTIKVSLAANQGWAYTVGEDEEGNPDPRVVSVEPVPTASAVRAMYVVLDQPNSVESKPSEWAAWTSYSYTGLNEVVEGTSVNITIDCGEHTGDIIGFRVYAVNYDGTLVDPDGRAFYVQLGDGKSTGGVDTKIVPQNDVDIKVADTLLFSDAEEFAIDVKGATSYTWTADVINYLADTSDDPEMAEPMLSFYPALFNKGTKAAEMFDKVVWSAADGTETYDMYGRHIGYSGSFEGFDQSKIALLATVPAIPDWLAYIDGKTYSGTLTLYNEDSHTGTKRAIKTIKITFTKELPTAAPAGYSTKSEQVINGLYVSYLIPDTWAADTTKNEKGQFTGGAKFGTMPMTSVFNFRDDAHVTLDAERFNITFAKSAIEMKDGKPVVVDVTVTGADTLKIAASFIDNVTKHATSVVYNYGKISTALYQKAKEQSKENDDVYTDYVVSVDAFETEYHDIYDPLYTWNWITLAQYNKYYKKNIKAADLAKLFTNKVKYGAGSGEAGDDPAFSVDLQYIFGTCAPDGKYNAPLSEPYMESLIVTGAKLISNANGKEEYFEIEIDGTTLNFAVLQDENGINVTTNPKADVPSTLVIELHDMYNHTDHVAKVPMTVLKR